jgi:hypothetical protein
MMVLASCAAPRQADPASAGSFTASTEEAVLLARYPKLARRHGKLLQVSSRGGWIDYLDTDRACDPDSCVSYVLDGEWLEGRLFGISVGYFEGGDYIVADTRSQHLNTGGPPIFSPNKQRFATAVYNEAYETSSEGIRIWEVEGWLRNVRTISPHVLGYPEGVRWRGNGCLEFTAVHGDLYDGTGRPRHRGTYYLVEAVPEWRLHEASPRACTR